MLYYYHELPIKAIACHLNRSEGEPDKITPAKCPSPASGGLAPLHRSLFFLMWSTATTPDQPPLRQFGRRSFEDAHPQTLPSTATVGVLVSRMTWGCQPSVTLTGVFSDHIEGSPF